MDVTEILESLLLHLYKCPYVASTLYSMDNLKVPTLIAPLAIGRDFAKVIFIFKL